jgi:hypothetical protein
MDERTIKAIPFMFLSGPFMPNQRMKSVTSKFFEGTWYVTRIEWEDEETIPCPQCHGAGELEVLVPIYWGKVMFAYRKNCDIITLRFKCARCGGSGKEEG